MQRDELLVVALTAGDRLSVDEIAMTVLWPIPGKAPLAFAALAATLFLGGWSVPWVHGVAADQYVMNGNLAALLKVNATDAR